MNLGYKHILTLLLTLIFLSGCLGVALPALPDIGIKQDNLNQELEIVLLQSNTYKIGEPIDVIVRLRSDIEVHSDNKFAARMFILEDESRQWEEVDDPVTSYSEELDFDLNDILGGSDEVVLSMENNQWGVILHPAIKNKSKHLEFLLILSGQVYENGVAIDRKVGAYKILTLQP